MLELNTINFWLQNFESPPYYFYQPNSIEISFLVYDMITSILISMAIV